MNILLLLLLLLWIITIEEMSEYVAFSMGQSSPLGAFWLSHKADGLTGAAQSQGTAALWENCEVCSLCKLFSLKTDIFRSPWGNLPKITLVKTLSNLSNSGIFQSDLNSDIGERSFLWLTMVGLYIIYIRKLHPLFQCTSKQNSNCCYQQLTGLALQQSFIPKFSKQIFSHTAIIRKIMLWENVKC